MTIKVEMHERSQKSIGSGQGKFGGPDTYIAVTYTPDGKVCPKVLNHKVLTNRGIKCIYCGEGYSLHRGPRSMLGQAIAKGKRLLQEAQKG